MARYIVRRLLWSFLLLILVSAVVFILFYVFPSADPAQLRAGRQANQDQIQAIRESLGLDHSVLTQFWIYIKGVFTPSIFRAPTPTDRSTSATATSRTPT